MTLQKWMLILHGHFKWHLVWGNGKCFLFILVICRYGGFLGYDEHKIQTSAFYKAVIQINTEVLPNNLRKDNELNSILHLN